MELQVRKKKGTRYKRIIKSGEYCGRHINCRNYLIHITSPIYGSETTSAFCLIGDAPAKLDVSIFRL